MALASTGALEAHDGYDLRWKAMDTEARATPIRRALDGIRVLDFTWHQAGPWGTRWLGALGAEVIKIEWPYKPSTRGDGAPESAPEGRPVDLNTVGYRNNHYANKLSVTVNPNTARGIDLMKRLVTISDIVVENFTPGVLERWGLGYDEMKKLRNDIIYLSMSGFGHTGRDQDYRMNGGPAQGMSGMTYLSGLPDIPPAGWGWVFLDDTGGVYGAISALSALYHRNMTGQGQHVDQSQWITGVALNGPAFLDIQANGTSTMREGYPPGNRAHWPGTPLMNNYRGRTVAPHNAYRTSPGGYNDWCAIACFSDQEWFDLISAMGSPGWAMDEKFKTLKGRLEHQEELDVGIEAWTMKLGKYEIMDLCQSVGVRSMPVQSTQDRVENDPQLSHREIYKDLEHLALGTWPLMNAPFKMSETPAFNSAAGPLIGQHNRHVFEGLLGMSYEELLNCYDDGTFWPKTFSMDSYPYIKEMLDSSTSIQWMGNKTTPNLDPVRMPSSDYDGAFANLRVLELCDEKGQWCGKLMADMGADVVKIEPPGGESSRTVGPFYQNVPHKERSLSFWHYNTSKRGVTLSLETEDGRRLFRQMASSADVIIETFRPGYMASLSLSYEDLKVDNPGLIVCSLTPFGQTGPWRDYATSDLLHLAAGGQMALCGYDENDAPDAPPIAPGGGQAWHMGGQYAYVAIASALVYRSVTGHGQYIDVSVHDSCNLTTSSQVDNYFYHKRVNRRQTPLTANPTRVNREYQCKDGKYITGGGFNRLTPERLRTLAEWMNVHNMSGDLLDDKYLDQDVINQNRAYINETLFNFFANISQDEAYHGGQKRGFDTAAIRSPDEVMEDPHLEDRAFWAEVEYPEVGKTFRHPGPAAIFNGSPWRISRRAPLIGEHNEDIICGELGLSRAELVVLAESSVV